jgi:catechol 2,3-dioxygenase-like lactoylglutathione lyase family enzyme
MTPEPIFDLAHLGHMELLTPKPDESLKFFVDVMGMTISGRKGESVYLRGWDDYERYSLKLTASKTSGMEHMALRARSQQALERRVAALKDSGFEIGWTDGDIGHGPASSIAYAIMLKDLGALYQTLYLVATAMELAPCAIGGGDADLFAAVAGLDYVVEPYIGEFILSSRNEAEWAAFMPPPVTPAGR